MEDVRRQQRGPGLEFTLATQTSPQEERGLFLARFVEVLANLRAAEKSEINGRPMMYTSTVPGTRYTS